MAYLTTHMRGPAERCRARTPRELTFWAVIAGRRLARKLAPSPHRSRGGAPNTSIFQSSPAPAFSLLPPYRMLRQQLAQTETSIDSTMHRNACMYGLVTLW